MTFTHALVAWKKLHLGLDLGAFPASTFRIASQEALACLCILMVRRALETMPACRCEAEGIPADCSAVACVELRHCLA